MNTISFSNWTIICKCQQIATNQRNIAIRGIVAYRVGYRRCNNWQTASDADVCDVTRVTNILSVGYLADSSISLLVHPLDAAGCVVLHDMWYTSKPAACRRHMAMSRTQCCQHVQFLPTCQFRRQCIVSPQGHRSVSTLQTLTCVLAARLRRCPTLSNSVLWQSWMAAYPGCTLQMKKFRGWPIMLHDTYTRRRRTERASCDQRFESFDDALLLQGSS